MSADLTTAQWLLVSAGATVVYMATMAWIMPTPKARLRTVLAPFAGWVFLIPNAAVKGYSVDHTLYIYSGVLLMFVIMFAPVAKRVAADIAEQEEKPWDKVPLNSFSLYWMLGSATVCIGVGAYLWRIIE
ncbi:hypothetical protein ACFUTR_26985 [Streptomyces sp. NPDC057367]|uniref:hypothetical protein n=1 Tax=Streptomyces sp. NPDC057367 TaxID=3346108 RepID=UPI0036434917